MAKDEQRDFQFGGWRGAHMQHHIKAHRGQMESIILEALADGPKNGYDIMEFFEDRTKGAWKPSAGSVYPVLKKLEEAQLADVAEVASKKLYTLTAAGQKKAKPAIKHNKHFWAAISRLNTRGMGSQAEMMQIMHLIKAVYEQQDETKRKKVEALLSRLKVELEKLSYDDFDEYANSVFAAESAESRSGSGRGIDITGSIRANTKADTKSKDGDENE